MSANTPAVNGTTDEALDQINDLVDGLGMRLYHLGKISELVAFASEARRILQAITDQFEYFPDFAKHIANNVEHSCNWLEMPNVEAQVAWTLSQEINDVKDDLVQEVQSIITRKSRKQVTA